MGRLEVEQVWLKILSEDESFLDFYGPLAHELGKHGAVYIPFALIAPNARMAIPPPREIVVEVNSAEALDGLTLSIRRYLNRFRNGNLTLVKGEREITLTSQSVANLTALLDELMLDAEKNNGV